MKKMKMKKELRKIKAALVELQLLINYMQRNVKK